MPLMSQTLADPINSGESATSDALARPDSKPAMGSVSEPMVDAPVEYASCQLGSGQVSRRAGGELLPSFSVGNGVGTADSRLVYLRCQTTRIHTGYSRTLQQAKGNCRNLGTLLPLPMGWPRRPANAPTRDGASVVVRERESRSHGKGRQWVR